MAGAHGGRNWLWRLWDRAVNRWLRLPFWPALGTLLLAGLAAGVFGIAAWVGPGLDAAAWFIPEDVLGTPDPKVGLIVLLLIECGFLAFGIAWAKDQVVGTVDTLALPSSGTFRPGALLGITLVGFGSMRSPEQEQLTRWLMQTIAESRPDAGGSSYHLWLKTVGASAVVYIEPLDVAFKWEADALALSLALNLSQQAAGRGTRLGVVLRHAEDVKYERIESSLEWRGHAWDSTRRMLPLTEDGHFLLAENAYNKLEHELFAFRRTHSLCSQPATIFWKELDDLCSGAGMLRPLPLPENAEVRVERSTACVQEQVWDVYSLSVCALAERALPETFIGNCGAPQSLIPQEKRREIEDPDNLFIHYLVAAEEVRIVGLTNQGLENYLHRALEQRGGTNAFWKRLEIIFPHPNVLKQVLEESVSEEDRYDEWRRGRFEVTRFLEGAGPPDQWSCLQSDRPFWFTGNQFHLPDGPSVIRYCPLLAGRQQRHLYYTLQEHTEAYARVSATLDTVMAGSTSISEWDIHGEVEHGELLYRGLAMRPHVESVGSCVPVVLVILHGTHAGKHHVFVQRRTEFNSSDGYNTFSNISGRLAVEDLLEPVDVERCHAGIERALVAAAPAYDEQRLRDRVTAEVHAMFGWTSGMSIGDEAWLRAAIREISEELGLTIAATSLVFHTYFNLKLGSDKADRYFRLFSLELQPDDIETIQRQRPHAELVPMTLGDVESDPDRLNRLLQRRLHELFVPIFRELGIAER